MLMFTPCQKLALFLSHLLIDLLILKRFLALFLKFLRGISRGKSSGPANIGNSGAVTLQPKPSRKPLGANRFSERMLAQILTPPLGGRER